jgi:hypothetical protein
MGVASCGALFFCAEHARQVVGGSPLPSLTWAKVWGRYLRRTRGKSNLNIGLPPKFWGAGLDLVCHATAVQQYHQPLVTASHPEKIARGEMRRDCHRRVSPGSRTKNIARSEVNFPVQFWRSKSPKSML